MKQTASIRIHPDNPDHHLWNNNGTFWCHYTLHLPDYTKRRVRPSPEHRVCSAPEDEIRDTEGFANALFKSITKMRKVLLPGLRRFREDPATVLSLVGRHGCTIKQTQLS